MSQLNRYKMVSMAVSVAMHDDDDDTIIISGIKRPRQHAFWMSPFLKDRTDPTQRNTLAKLEVDFIRVSMHITLPPPAINRKSANKFRAHFLGFV